MSKEDGMALVKFYGKILGVILAFIITISSTIIAARAVKALDDRDTWKASVESRFNEISRDMLTREDIRSELNCFKLDLIESGMIIVPARAKSNHERE